jgi:hypothetical protein
MIAGIKKIASGSLARIRTKLSGSSTSEPTLGNIAWRLIRSTIRRRPASRIAAARNAQLSIVPAASSDWRAQTTTGLAQILPRHARVLRDRQRTTYGEGDPVLWRAKESLLGNVGDTDVHAPRERRRSAMSVELSDSQSR